MVLNKVTSDQLILETNFLSTCITYYMIYNNSNYVGGIHQRSLESQAVSRWHNIHDNIPIECQINISPRACM